VENLFVFFIVCNPTDNFDVGVDDRIYMSADFGEGLCSFLLAILTTYCCNTISLIQADAHHDGGNM
jgi:hypothetical protein